MTPTLSNRLFGLIKEIKHHNKNNCFKCTKLSLLTYISHQIISLILNLHFTIVVLWKCRYLPTMYWKIYSIRLEKLWRDLKLLFNSTIKSYHRHEQKLEEATFPLHQCQRGLIFFLFLSKTLKVVAWTFERYYLGFFCQSFAMLRFSLTHTHTPFSNIFT